ncbi:hypothetical protein H0H93_011338, partial [Arthromyces matolae]
GIICYAQDTQGRHVAIKAVVDGSEELRILKYLRTQPIASSIEEFHHVIPILDILPCEGHWLAVMPRSAHHLETSSDMLIIGQVGHTSPFP